MGLAEKKVAPGLAKARSTPAKASRVVMVALAAREQGHYASGKKNLPQILQSLLLTARTARGWDKQELAKRMAEKINIVVNNVEAGKRPTDTVIEKLERTLDITVVDASPDENRHVNSGQSRVLL